MQEEMAKIDTELFAYCVSGSQGLSASALYPVPEGCLFAYLYHQNCRGVIMYVHRDTPLHLLAKLHERANAYVCMNTRFTYACAYVWTYLSLHRLASIITWVHAFGVCRRVYLLYARTPKWAYAHTCTCILVFSYLLCTEHRQLL